MKSPTMAYLATGFNFETGAFWRQEEQDQEGAEHAAASWLERQPLFSLADVLSIGEHPPYSCKVTASARRVMAGIEWRSP